MPRFVDISGTAPIGAAATVRTAIDAVGKGELVHNVLDYGAAGDGIADDTAEIHAARDAAGVGGKLFFPAGTYLSSLTASVADQTWELSEGAVVNMKTGSSHVLNITATGVTVTGGVFDGTNGTATNGTQQGLVINADDAVVENLTVQNTPQYGISTYDHNNVTIRGCTVINTYAAGIWIQNQLAAPSNIYDISVIDCLVDNSAAGDRAAGITAYGGLTNRRVNRVKFIGNTVRIPYDQSDVNTGCLGVINATDAVLDGNVCSGSYISISCANIVNTAITNNVIRGFKYVGIELPEGTDGVAVVGNMLNPDGVAGTSPSGIQASNGAIEDLTIAGNTLLNFTRDNSTAIKFASGAIANRVSVTGNVISGAGYIFKGIFFTDEVENISVSGNIIDGTGSTTSSGIEFAYSITGASITGNHFSNLTLGAVRFGTGSAITQDYIRLAGNGYVSCGPILVNSNYGAGAGALGSNVSAAEKVAVPASAGAAGSIGSWAADSSYAYFCTAANTWKRVAIATW